jgi:hypothetical protein
MIISNGGILFNGPDNPAGEVDGGGSGKKL